jgi:hypothetical protein
MGSARYISALLKEKETQGLEERTRTRLMILLVYSITTAGAVVVGFFSAVAYPMLYLSVPYCLPLFMAAAASILIISSR